VVARLVAEKMKVDLGAPIVVENRAGAAGQVAARMLKSAPADGRTLMVTTPAPTVLAPITFAHLDYDPVRDFAPVSLAADFALALAVSRTTPVKSLGEYAAWLREDPRRTAYGVPAAGSLAHLFGLLLSQSLDVEMVHVPYKGGAPLMSDLVGGQIPAAVVVFAEAVALHRERKITLLAMSGAGRAAIEPGVPTFAEQGFPQLVGGGWVGFFAPAATPRASVARLSAAVARAIGKPDVSERLTKLGFEPVGSTPEALARRMAEQRAQWQPLAKASGLMASQ
jgi:tripartite-type tricarboxylate transporter receptor subunit TctC